MQRQRILYIFIGIISVIALSIGGVVMFRKSSTRTAPTVPVIEEQPAPRKEPLRFEFQKGITYIAWTKDGYSNPSSIKSIEELVSLGVEWVCLVVTWYQDQLDSTAIYPITDKTPSDKSLLFAIRKIHDLNLKIMLKPHLDLVKSDGKWRGDIGFADASAWEDWFSNYTDFILHYANLAEQEHVELLCVGTELTNATLNQPESWRVLIKQIREVYSGGLTYAANWYDEFDNIEFWDELDYAGIDSYFPLVCSTRPTLEELKEVWQDWLQMIESWQREIDKPVIFTEIGYKSSLGTTDEPWGHSPLGELDLQLQADCYEALLSTFWDKPWFYGVYWWYWGVNPRMGGKFHRGFTPQNKPAQDIIAQWYKKPVPQKSY